METHRVKVNKMRSCLPTSSDIGIYASFRQLSCICILIISLLVIEAPMDAHAKTDLYGTRG